MLSAFNCLRKFGGRALYPQPYRTGFYGAFDKTDNIGNGIAKEQADLMREGFLELHAEPHGSP